MTDKRIISILTVLLLSIGLFRLFEFVLHSPVLAYGNNFDMARIQGCVDVWPDVKGEDIVKKNPSAPYENYRYNPLIQADCYYSSQLFFVNLGLRLAVILEKDFVFSLKYFGFVNALVLSLTVIAFTFYFFRKNKLLSALANAAIFSVVLTDPANLLFLNTFYTEFSALYFSYLALLVLYCLSQDKQNIKLMCVGGVALFGLALSRHAHVLLPGTFFILYCFFVITVKDSSILEKRFIVLTSLIILSAMVFQFFYKSAYSEAVSQANLTNTYLGAVLPAAEDRAEALNYLGLPEECAHVVGENWYTLGGDHNMLCLEVRDLSRLNILSLMWKEPGLFWRLSQKGIEESRPWVSSKLGHVAGEKYGTIEGKYFSLSFWISSLSVGLLTVLFCLPVCTVLLLFKKASNTLHRSFCFLLVSLVLGGYLVFYISILGDGFVDLPKHAHLYFNFYISALIVCFFSGIHLLLNKYKTAK